MFASKNVKDKKYSFGKKTKTTYMENGQNICSNFKAKYFFLLLLLLFAANKKIKTSLLIVKWFFLFYKHN